ncbi:hypothetical protein QR680_015567 [Steinernema hermaphroditum]|uniref:Uncharacterized protein n=1 Tax=Steinernema hermaphroditum TaxID=289476 RepID=A0AA39H881_9BILA|nr:hypothetical protein QR680_015567 [Steinernema hermaphroditum]
MCYNDDDGCKFCCCTCGVLRATNVIAVLTVIIAIGNMKQLPTADLESNVQIPITWNCSLAIPLAIVCVGLCVVFTFAVVLFNTEPSDQKLEHWIVLAIEFSLAPLLYTLFQGIRNMSSNEDDGCKFCCCTCSVLKVRNIIAIIAVVIAIGNVKQLLTADIESKVQIPMLVVNLSIGVVATIIVFRTWNCSPANPLAIVCIGLCVVITSAVVIIIIEPSEKTPEHWIILAIQYFLGPLVCICLFFGTKQCRK